MQHCDKRARPSLRGFDEKAVPKRLPETTAEEKGRFYLESLTSSLLPRTSKKKKFGEGSAGRRVSSNEGRKSPLWKARTPKARFGDPMIDRSSPTRSPCHAKMATKDGLFLMADVHPGLVERIFSRWRRSGARGRGSRPSYWSRIKITRSIVRNLKGFSPSEKIDTTVVKKIETLNGYTRVLGKRARVSLCHSVAYIFRHLRGRAGDVNIYANADITIYRYVNI